ncbi:MAG: hypothetical protein AAB467_02600, partial [Patescibacteria group bacterium]
MVFSIVIPTGAKRSGGIPFTNCWNFIISAIMAAFFIFTPNLAFAATTTPDITFAPSSNWSEWVVRYFNETGRGQTFKTGPTTTAFRSVALKLCRVANFTKPKTLTFCASAANNYYAGCQSPLASKTFSASDLNAMVPFKANCFSNLEGGPNDGVYYKWVNFTLDNAVAVSSSANYFFLLNNSSSNDYEPTSVLQNMYNNCNYLGTSQNYPDGQTYSYYGSSKRADSLGASCDMFFKTYSSDPNSIVPIPTINNPPALSFATDTPNGINTSTIFLPAQPTFKIVYSDPDNDAPRVINVIVNSSTYPMSLAQSPNYSSGTIFTFTAPTGTFAKGDYSYYFEAGDGHVTTTLASPPSQGGVGGPALRSPSEGGGLPSFVVKNVPVILVPGIMGSWNVNGIWQLDPILNTYDNLWEALKSAGYEENETLFAFPYQWRYSNVYTAELLKLKISAVKQICGCNKVDLVAHSMGGLVARQYIEGDNYDNDVGKLIFLATPHKGASKAYLI